jgi:beta-glucosidase
MKHLYLFAILFFFTLFAKAQQVLPYKNPQLPIEVRVADLLGRMTPEEKFRQLFMVPGDLGNDSSRFDAGLFGFQTNTSEQAENAANQMLRYNPGKDIPGAVKKNNSIQHYFVEKSRLGIPVIFFDEALHGLMRSGATAFPQSIALAATFDTALTTKVSTAIAEECKAWGIRQVLSSVVNLATDVRWGRVEETYGEDPYLVSQMGVAYVKSFEDKSIITTPKHFVVNHGDGGRDSYPVYLSERGLEESYFIPFKAVVKQGRTRSIMTAYNSLNGRPCTQNNWLLNEKLKKEWGFRGMVISDAGATGGANVLHFTAKDYEDAGKQAIENGMDVIFQSGFGSYDLFKKPFLDGSVEATKMDSAVARVLRVKFELGLFDQPYVNTSANEINFAEHRKIAKEAALESIVLLKNDEKKILPLSDNYKRIAVIGTDATEARLGGYSGPGNDKINILDGLKQTSGKDAEVVYSEGCGRSDAEWKFVDASCLFHPKDGKTESGLLGEYFNNIDLSGKPVLTRVDNEIKFQWTLFSPHPSINYDFFSVRWSGEIVSPLSGKFKIGIDGNDGYRLYLDEKLIIDTWNQQSYHTTLADFDFVKDKKYKIRIEYKEPSGNSWFRLVWNIGLDNKTEEKIQEAVGLAEKSDVTIVVAGIEEGEFRDRSKLNLPGKQEEMILRLAATGKPVVVVLVGGSAITMDRWIDKVNAIMDVWYPGEVGGEAVAEILTGKYNPSGKLPITFPRTEGQLPLIYNHKPTGRGDDYSDGSGQPLFPFGYGLSYTDFEYSNVVLSKKQISATESASISFKIKNTGKFDGTEVAQLYLYDELASVVRPVKELKAFQRVFLKTGEEKEISFSLTPEMFTLLDENLKTVTEPGFFRIMIGSSSKDIRLRERIEIK